MAIATIGAVALVCGGCSSSSDGADSASPAGTSAGASAAAAAPAKAEGGDFCSLYATKVAQGLVNMRTAQSDVVAAEGIADELAKKAAVSQAELVAVAPPEPKTYLDAIEKDDAAGAAGDLSASDDLLKNINLMNDWAIKNCDAKYRSIFTEYNGIVG